MLKNLGHPEVTVYNADTYHKSAKIILGDSPQFKHYLGLFYYLSETTRISIFLIETFHTF